MLEWITQLMHSAGYTAVAALMFLENVFPPIPSEIIMPLAGYTARQSQLSFAGVALAGTLGSVLGALPFYWLGRKAGLERVKAWTARHGRWLALHPQDLEKSQRWFDRHGGASVLLGRLVPGVRSLISVPAGIHRMGFGMFLFYTAIGSAVWSFALTLAGYLLAQNFQKVDAFIGPVSWVVLGALGLWYLVRVIRWKPEEGAK